MIRNLKFLLCTIFALFAMSCNHEVFEEDDIDTSSLSATIDGDGGTVSFDINTDKLQAISLTQYNNDNCTYYDANGQEIPSTSQAKDVSYINFKSMLLDFKIYITDKKLTFESIENSSDYDYEIEVKLNYTYISRYVMVKIRRGQPIRLYRVTYNDDMTVDSTYKVEKNQLVVNNTGSTPSKVEIYPYLNSSYYCDVEPTASWAKKNSITMQRPELIDGTWQLGDNITLTMSQREYLSLSDRNSSEEVTIPANTKTIVVTTVTYSRATITGTIIYQNPVSQRQFTTDFTCSAVAPVGYEISFM